MGRKLIRLKAWAGLVDGRRLAAGMAMSPRLPIFRTKAEAERMHDAVCRVEIREIRPTRKDK